MKHRIHKMLAVAVSAVAYAVAYGLIPDPQIRDLLITAAGVLLGAAGVRRPGDIPISQSGQYPVEKGK